MAPPPSSSISPLCRFHFPFLSVMNPSPSNPLFSALVALYTLILLYFPSFFLNLLLSPLLLSAGFLLLSLLRLGAAQNARPNHPLKPPQTQTEEPPPPSERSVSPPEHANRRTTDPLGSFLEWDVGAPLPVIHEGEDEGAVGCDGGRLLERHPSLSRYYPESDSDSGSDSDSESSCSAEIDEFERSPARGRFRWEEEERDGLIEIKLDGDCVKKKVVGGLDLQFEEDNLIEIDISPAAGGDDDFPASTTAGFSFAFGSVMSD